MNKRNLMIAILSMSTLTVMAGAAISPALNAISLHFSDASPTAIKMLITLPCFFIILTSLNFQRLSRVMGVKSMALLGISLYLIGGLGAAFCPNITLVFIFRAILGVGVGIIMPLSTGLLSFYFDKSQQQKLLGYSSAMNNLGGVIATIISAYLATLGWNYSFAVYLLGLLVGILVVLYVPNDHIKAESSKLENDELKKIAPYLFTIFLVMLAYMNMPTNLAVVALSQDLIAPEKLGFLMSINAVIAFIFGFILTRILKFLGGTSKYVGFGLLALGLFLLGIATTLPLALFGQSLLGFSMGIVVPMINSQIALNLKPAKVTTAMALMSASLYLGQFFAPIVVDVILKVFNLTAVGAPFIVASIIAFILLIYSIKVKYIIR
ncbi:MAG: MFS transporter [Erysipelotrichales bacterium]